MIDKQGARRYERERGAGNLFAFLTLMCGIGCWVPLVVVLTAPLMFGFFALAHATGAHHAVRAPRGSAGRFNVAWSGLVLGLLGIGLQVAVTLVVVSPAWLRELLR